MGVIAAALSTLGVLVVGALVTAWIESRLAPWRAERGPAQRLVMRRELVPARRDPWMYAAAPGMAVAAVALGAVVIPFGPELVGQDLEIGLFYFIVVVDLVVLAIALGGWGANTPRSVEACYRAVAQLVAYVVALGLAVLGPIMMARSLSTVDIVEAQREAGLWYVAAQPLGFALYVATALMQSYRGPFLEPFARQIDFGVVGVFGGLRALLWRLALSGLLFVVAAMGAVLFLGGYAGPWLPGPVWMVLKTLAMVVLLAGIGARLRPRSTAEMLALSWKVLIPVGLANVLLVGLLILLGVGQSPFSPVGPAGGP